MLRVKIRNSFDFFWIFFISYRLIRDIGWNRVFLEVLDIGISILKLRIEVLSLFLKELYHCVALIENSITLDDLVLSVAYRLLTLSYHLVSGGNYCLKLFRLSDLPIQLAMSNLCLSSQVDNTVAL